MIKKNFVLKLIGCVIIVASLFYYNKMMELNGELSAANKTLAQMENQAAAAAADPTSSAEAQGQYKDGTYSGTAQGYGGPVTTQITIENGYITGIEITSAEGEDAAYYNMCLGILDEIAASQSADVDTVSGATYTSDGIIGGAKEALNEASKS